MSEDLSNVRLDHPDQPQQQGAYLKDQKPDQEHPVSKR
jgi:hypothetical protein